MDHPNIILYSVELDDDVRENYDCGLEADVTSDIHRGKDVEDESMLTSNENKLSICKMETSSKELTYYFCLRRFKRHAEGQRPRKDIVENVIALFDMPLMNCRTQRLITTFLRRATPGMNKGHIIKSKRIAKPKGGDRRESAGQQKCYEN